MKYIHSAFKYLVFSVIAFAMVAAVQAQQMVQATAKVVRIKGEARYSTANNTWQTLKVGDQLRAGTIIQTAKESRVDIVLGDKDATAPQRNWGNTIAYQPEVEQDFVRVYENSVMAVEKLLVADTGAEKIRETSLDLRAGKIFGTVKKLAAGSKYEVKVPNGVAGIRGTVYMISAERVLTVLKGSVVIAYSDGTGSIVTQVVVAGQQYDIRTAQFTPIPEPLMKDGQSASYDALSTLPPGLEHFPEDHNNHHVSPTAGHPGFEIVPN
ncbi:MAG: hypothetical protein RLY20_2806 [Verrucomicrobiota bacterium]|jgi:hypothetical protein